MEKEEIEEKIERLLEDLNRPAKPFVPVKFPNAIYVAYINKNHDYKITTIFLNEPNNVAITLYR